MIYSVATCWLRLEDSFEMYFEATGLEGILDHWRVDGPFQIVVSFTGTLETFPNKELACLKYIINKERGKSLCTTSRVVTPLTSPLAEMLT